MTKREVKPAVRRSNEENNPVLPLAVISKELVPVIYKQSDEQLMPCEYFLKLAKWLNEVDGDEQESEDNPGNEHVLLPGEGSGKTLWQKIFGKLYQCCCH